MTMKGEVGVKKSWNNVDFICEWCLAGAPRSSAVPTWTLPPETALPASQVSPSGLPPLMKPSIRLDVGN